MLFDIYRLNEDQPIAECKLLNEDSGNPTLYTAVVSIEGKVYRVWVNTNPEA